MLSDATPAVRGIRVERLALIAMRTIALTAMTAGLWLLAWWGLGLIAAWIWWKAALIFLLALEILHRSALVLGLLALPMLPGVAWLRPGRWRTAAARGLLLYASTAIGLVASEAVTAIWRVHAHRRTAVPVGGLGRGAGETRAAAPSLAADDLPLPTQFPDPPGDRDIDVVVLGESSAEGVPYNGWLSVGAIIAWQLGEAFPDRRARLHLLARMGDTLEGQHRRLAELARRPDLLIVYCGHNEFDSRLAPSREVDHYRDRGRPGAWALLADRLERTSAFCGLVRETAEKCRLAIPAPPGRGALVDVPAFTPAEFAALLEDYRRRLDAIVAYAVRVGAIPVVIVPPGNDADFEPNRSYLPADTPRAGREAFERAFLAARRAEAVDPGRARALYRGLLARQPGFAEAHFRLARLLERAGERDDAYRHFVAARDRDGYPIRCPGPFQDACRSVAGRRGGILVDGQALFRAIGPHGLLDDHLFQDAVHPSLRGHIALAQAVLAALRTRGAWGWPADRPAIPIDPARCAAHFGMVPDSWKVVCSIGAATYVKMSAWTHDGGERLRKAAAFDEALRRIDRGTDPESAGLPNLGIPEAVPMPPSGPESGDR